MSEFWTINPSVLFENKYATLTNRLNIVCKFAIMLFVLTFLLGSEPMMLFLPIIMIVGTIMMHKKSVYNTSVNRPIQSGGDGGGDGGGGTTPDKPRTRPRPTQQPKSKCDKFPYEPFERQHNDDEYADIVVGNKDLDENCTQPTTTNPFMNPLYGSVQNSACNANNPDITADIKDKFYHDHIDDPSMPEYLKRNQLGFHSFYTVPSTSHPSQQEEFAQYLYGNMDNCKTNNCDCKPN